MAKSLLERREVLCMNKLRNTIETYGLHVLRPQSFQNMLTSSHIIRFGMGLNLSTETHIGTPVGLKKPFTLDFTLTISIGIAEQTAQQPMGTTADL